MTTRYSAETTGHLDGTLPSTPVDSRLHGGKLRRIRASFDLSTATFASGDILVLGDMPQGAAFSHGLITASATMGATATIAIGISGATGKYRTAAVFTAVDTPTAFGNAAAKDDVPLAATERLLATIAAAALPAAGILVIDIFYTTSA